MTAETAPETVPERAHAEDGALVERARRGDAAAYEALVRRHQQAALRLAAAVR
jgi:hypothetical protein